MSDTKKTIPNVECLKYHGTKDKPDIKIFVSNRIDLDSINIENPLYIPVRCGAIYDKRKNVDMIGDDTGDNISEKRMSYNELTVQYWAWKNIDADYYGLCHYRRYLGFSPLKYKTATEERNNGCVAENYLNDAIIMKHELFEKNMRKQIAKYDIIVCSSINAHKSNYQCMKDSPDYHNIADMDNAIKIIKEKYPEMAKTVDEYMISENVRLYNCFIMKKDIFKAYSSWLFDILFTLEKQLDMSLYDLKKFRTPGTIGERLFGIYCLWLKKQRNIRFKENQLVFFEHAENQKILKPFFGNEQITIVTNFNENYSKFFSCSFISMLSHFSPEKKYEIIVLSEDISIQSKNRLTEICNNIDNVKISYHNPYPYFNLNKLSIREECYSKDLFVRPLIPYILRNYNKCIVIDADTICKTDLAKLYETDIGTNTIAAVRDTVLEGWLNQNFNQTKDYLEKEIGLINPYNYCNTGVLILNCKQYREKYTIEYLINHIENQNYRIYEQDMLNILFENDIYFLPTGWNLFTCTNSIIKNSLQAAPCKDYLLYQDARKNPFILHYANQPKPWLDSKSDFADEFWKYARKSPFYEEIIETMILYLINSKQPENYNLRFNNVEEFARAVERRLSSTEYKVRRFERLLGFPILRRIRKLIKK